MDTTTTPPKPQFAIGDKVTYTATTESGNSLNFHAREGVILQIGEGVALIQKRNGRKEWFSLKGVRGTDQKTAVHDLLESLAGQASPTA